MKNKIIPILALGVLCLLGVAATNVTVLWFSQAPHATLAGTDILLLERPSPHTNMNFTVAELKTYANNGMSSTADLNGASNVLRTAQIQSTNDLNTTFTSRLNTTSNILLNASNLLGKVQTANLGYSGTANSSTFLRGDNTWQTPAGVGDVTAAGQNNFSGSNYFGGATTIASLANTTQTIGTAIVTNLVAGIDSLTNGLNQTLPQILTTNQNWVHQFGSATLTNLSAGTGTGLTSLLTSAVTNALPAVLTNSVSGSIQSTVGTRTLTHDSTHTVITNTATLTSTEFTAGSQKDWYNGSTTMVHDKTNGQVSAVSFVNPTNGVMLPYYVTVDTTKGYMYVKTNADFTLAFDALPAINQGAVSQGLIEFTNSAASGGNLITIAGVNNQASVTCGYTNGQTTYIAWIRTPWNTNVCAWDTYKAILK